MTTRIVSAWRSISLILIGCVMGAMLAGPVSAQVGPSARAIEPAATYARMASCTGLAFHPIDSNTLIGHRTGQIFSLYASTGDNYFVCDPGLPNKATVTKLTFSIRDDQPAARVQDCALVRVPLAPATAETLLVMGSVPATLVNDVPNNLLLSTSSINHALVDLSRFTYFLQCRLGNGTGLFGASVSYTISSTNG